jgi:hypothetical protein
MLKHEQTIENIEQIGLDVDYIKKVFLAKTKNYKPNTYYHVQTGGSNAGVGKGLYLGRDKQALINFYDVEAEAKPVDTYTGQA